MQTKWTHGPGTSVRPTPASGTSWRSSLTQIYGSPEQNPQFWGSISANSYLLDISGPLQLHHGMADSEVPLEFSETLYYQMLAVGKYVELYKYDGDNHNISNYFTAAMQRSVEFFDRFVKNP
jgi:dipeptidyl aminopeptidase/acylaminoacyl peptidase